tara:strand:- start:5957 stop:6172 length:216 start_codon:yes stop_codon:yes gene_type:complete
MKIRCLLFGHNRKIRLKHDPESIVGVSLQDDGDYCERCKKVVKQKKEGCCPGDDVADGYNRALQDILNKLC